MQPPVRTTHSNASPGLIDCPSGRRPSTIVAQEKAKRQQAATLKAEELCQRAAQVSDVKREVRKAQAEAQPARRGGRAKVTKKTFLRPDEDVNVS